MLSLTQDELLRLLMITKRENELHWLMILLSFNHGLRPSEVCEMTVGQVTNGYIYIPRKKGSESTLQRMTSEEREAIERQIKNLSPKDRIFPMTTRWYQKLMNKYGEMAGIPGKKCTPHKLKHTCAMLSIEKGMKIHEVQTRLGHKSLSSTGRYLRISDGQADDAFSKAFDLK